MGSRRIGMFGATLVGLGGILGGGIFLLAGTAFQSAGPSAILAFALNGAVAWLTAMSVSEMSTTFPESGGAYTFAKKVLSVRAAFAMGWVLWFAYIVAAVLYALGFAAFTVKLLEGVVDALGWARPGWLDGRNPVLLLASAATAVYSIGLVRKGAGGGKWETIGKIVLFGVLILAGAIAFVREPETAGNLDPFFTGGLDGLIGAMGLTFISLQGFEMIAAVAGEIKEPRVTIPKAVFLSLAISLAIYLLTMLLVASAGVAPGTSITDAANANADTVMAVAARRFLGEAGYWLIIVSIILATLSALQANLLIASRVAFAMASDQTLPAVMEQRHATRGTPVMAIYATALAVVAIMYMIPDLASAGAAASLIFLFAFALTHVTGYLARKRGGNTESAYQTPMFPVVPLVGGAACAGLGVFQAVIVPDAGGIVLIWLGLGVILYFALFKGRAEVADASAEAFDPALAKLRGKSPLVLLPIANPTNARSLVEVANALAPTEFARVLLLTIIRQARGSGNTGDALAELASAQDAVRQALITSYAAGHAPEALLTAAPKPWDEIRRVAEEHRCESLLLGLPDKADDEHQLEKLINELDCDVAVMRAPTDWRIGTAKRVLVAVGGRGEEHELRARLLATLSRESPRDIVFVTVVPVAASDDDVAATVKVVTRLATIKIPVPPTVQVIRSDEPTAAILGEAARFDLLLLGLHSRQGRKVMGTFNRRLAFDAPCAVILLSQRHATTASAVVQPIRDVASEVAKVIPWPIRRGDSEPAGGGT